MREKTFCVERIVSQKFPQRAVVRVRTGARDDIRGRSCAVAELRVRRVRQDAKFRDGVHGRFQHKSAINVVEIVRAINQEIVGFGPLPIYRVRLAVAQRSSGLLQARRDRSHTRLQQTKLREVPAIQR